jgi:hypothetical protein
MADCSAVMGAVACEQSYCVDSQGQRLGDAPAPVPDAGADTAAPVTDGGAHAPAPVTDSGADVRVLDSSVAHAAADGGLLGSTGCRSVADCTDGGMHIAINFACVAPYQPDPSPDAEASLVVWLLFMPTSADATDWQWSGLSDGRRLPWVSTHGCSIGQRMRSRSKHGIVHECLPAVCNER